VASITVPGRQVAAVRELTPELSILGSAGARRLLVMRSGQLPVGDLIRERRGSVVRARWGDHHWTFERVGLTRSRVLLRHEASDTHVGWFFASTKGGELVLADHRLSLVGGPRRSVSLVDTGGQAVVMLTLPHTLFAPWASVRIAPQLAGEPAAPLAALFLTYLQWQRGADVRAAAATYLRRVAG